jgi:hypothetical protein
MTQLTGPGKTVAQNHIGEHERPANDVLEQ